MNSRDNKEGYKRSLSGIVAGYLQFFIDGALRLLIMPFLLTHLGPTLMGFRALMLEIINYLQLVTPGANQAMQLTMEKEVMPHPDTPLSESLKSRMIAGAQIQALTALVVLLIVSGIAAFFSFGDNEFTSDERVQIGLFTLCSGLTISIMLFGAHHASILTATQHHKELWSALMTMKLLQAFVTVVLVWLGFSLFGAGIGVVCGALLFFLIRRRRSNKTGYSFEFYQGRLQWSAFPTMVVVGGWLVLFSIGELLGFQSFRLVVAMLPQMGLIEVNALSLTLVFPLLLYQLANFASFILRPAIKQHYHSNPDSRSFDGTLRAYLKWTFYAAVSLGFATHLFNQSFVSLWVGEQYFVGDRANLLIAMTFGLWLIVNAIKHLLYVFHELRLRAAFCVVEGALIVLGGFIGGGLYGMPGVFGMAVVVLLVISLPAHLVLVSKWVPHRRRFLSNVVISALVGVIALASYLFLANMGAGNENWFTFLANGTVFLMICTAVFIACFYSELRANLSFVP